jgi:hypothetical protein
MFFHRVPLRSLVVVVLGTLCLLVTTAAARRQRSAAVAAGTPAAAAGAEQFIGTWKLVSMEERDANGKLVEPLDYGPNPVGLIIYDNTGHMSAQAMRRGRPKLPSDDVHLAPPDQAKAALVGYNAYWGRYEVRAAEGLVIHHVEGSMIPNWEGGDQRRHFTFQDDKLILEPPPIQAAGQTRVRRLTWQRVK